MRLFSARLTATLAANGEIGSKRVRSLTDATKRGRIGARERERKKSDGGIKKIKEPLFSKKKSASVDLAKRRKTPSSEEEDV